MPHRCRRGLHGRHGCGCCGAHHGCRCCRRRSRWPWNGSGSRSRLSRHGDRPTDTDARAMRGCATGSSGLVCLRRWRHGCGGPRLRAHLRRGRCCGTRGVIAAGRRIAGTRQHLRHAIDHTLRVEGFRDVIVDACAAAFAIVVGVVLARHRCSPTWAHRGACRRCRGNGRACRARGFACPTQQRARPVCFRIW